MKQSILTVVFTSLLTLHVSAFPHLNPQALQDLLKRDSGSKGCPFGHDKAHNREKRAVGFDPVAQHVSTTGQYAFVPPNIAAGDKRGPCPGLNALANHGYLPHNGIAPSTTIIQAVNQVYGMALDLATFLSVYGTVFDGDSLSLTPGYSIGGPSTLGGILSGAGILRTPSGLTGSHNNYEGDTSATRGDLYVVGNDDLLQLDLFQQYYDALLDNTPAPQQYSALFPFRQARFNASIENNPYFFFPQFAGVMVAPAGFAFPPAMMSNKSAQYPEGYLDKETFKSFFAVSGKPGSFKYQQGYERIPDNWYKRAIGDEYTIPDFLLDVLQFGLKDSRLLSVGGNTGTTNSYTGVDVTALSKGVFNGATLAQGNNLQCFIFQLIQAEAPGVLTGVYENLTEALQPLVDNLNGNLKGLGCPQLMGVDQSLYNQFPGYTKAKGV
ncbi:MAG: hypothetical protein LQ338_001251 [Usnochroma carphineum]|nr:MAG: hypothetical protein LQ338_001251 [Usnochroma carphineum]